MKQQETQVQKGKNATHKLLIVIILFYSTFSFSQNIIEGTYYEDNNPSYVVDGGEYTYYKFYKNGTFKRNTYGELGEIDYAKGHYYLKKDSLIFDYDLTDVKTNDYHRHKFYLNNKDSVNIKISIRDTDNKPLSGIRVLSLKNRIEKESNNLGFIEFSLKKKSENIELYVVNNALGYYFNVWTNRNYDIEVFLRNDNYASSFKNLIIKYKLLSITKDSITLRNEKYTTVLKKKE